MTMNNRSDSQGQALKFFIGQEVFHDGGRYLIIGMDGDRLALRSAFSGKTKTANLPEVSPLQEDEAASDFIVKGRALSSIPDEEWKAAVEKAMLYAEALKAPRGEREKRLQEVAEKLGISLPSAYRQMSRYRKHRTPLVFMKKPRSDAKKPRTDAQVEEIIQTQISEYYLSEQKPRVTDLYRRIVIAIRNENRLREREGLEPLGIPHINTIYNRVSTIGSAAMAMRRQGKKGADAYRPLRGASHEEVVRPLQKVQIDHTPLDIIVVDDEERKPIGRPTLTIAIDIFTRAIYGFCLSLEAPSVLQLGLCVSQAALKKDGLMIEHDVQGEWPVHGLPETIHVDNGKEFHSKSFERACQRYGVVIERRPVKTPHFGGHVERIFKTINEEVHQLPGSTFSSVAKKLEYDPEKHASLTLSELEAWLIDWIANVYHREPHSALGISPLDAWKRAVSGDENIPGSGQPPLPRDPDRFKIDFLPEKLRSVQRYGIKLFGIDYWHDLLRKWVRQTEPKRGAKKFLVKYDPRDISLVFFHDPDMDAYFSIPWRNASRRPISLWEYQTIAERLRKAKGQRVTPDEVFDSRARLIERADAAREKTLKTRRKRQRLRNASQQALPAQAAEEPVKVDPAETVRTASLFQAEEPNDDPLAFDLDEIPQFEIDS